MGGIIDVVQLELPGTTRGWFGIYKHCVLRTRGPGEGWPRYNHNVNHKKLLERCLPLAIRKKRLVHTNTLLTVRLNCSVHSGGIRARWVLHAARFIQARPRLSLS